MPIEEMRNFFMDPPQLFIFQYSARRSIPVLSKPIYSRYGSKYIINAVVPNKNTRILLQIGQLNAKKPPIPPVDADTLHSVVDFFL